jgi:thioredoxin reductase (NADPH)
MAENDLRAVAFPKLDEAQMASLERCPLTVLKQYRDREKLFETGQRDCSFYVVKSGQVEIVDESGETPKTITIHGPGEFTGEVGQLTGGPSLVTAVARGDCEVYEVSSDAFRQLLDHNPELGDMILQAFIARREVQRHRGLPSRARQADGINDSVCCYRLRQAPTTDLWRSAEITL